jgi:hypothetical protein
MRWGNCITELGIHIGFYLVGTNSMFRKSDSTNSVSKYHTTRFIGILSVEIRTSTWFFIMSKKQWPSRCSHRGNAQLSSQVAGPTHFRASVCVSAALNQNISHGNKLRTRNWYFALIDTGIMGNSITAFSSEISHHERECSP